MNHSVVNGADSTKDFIMVSELLVVAYHKNLRQVMLTIVAG